MSTGRGKLPVVVANEDGLLDFGMVGSGDPKLMNMARTSLSIKSIRGKEKNHGRQVRCPGSD